MDGEDWVQRQSLFGHRSDSKAFVGQKRGILEVEETSESSQKRVKMRDLESVFRSAAQGGRGDSNKANPDVDSDSRALDLNANVCAVNDVSGKEKVECSDGLNKAKGFDLDLNAEDISSSINDPFYPYKNYENLRPRDDLECGSSVGGKDSMRVWKGLKQNNYMSGRGAVPVAIPKPRGRKKSSSDVMKRKIELAKKEQVDRFARVAAPSGLLNGLNPGIINHVRNSKQVHSIIEAIVRSEKTENELCGINRFGQIKNSGQDRVCSKMPSHCNIEKEDGKLALKLSSSENTSCLSNDESANLGSVTSLTVKAANVASQWLELLNQDIRGRLAALRRSKKRVGAVINTELPLLISKEFSGLDQATADAHSVRWSTIFGQMDKALVEEESHLESWLKQVKEMQLHCEKGIYKNSLNDSRSEAVDNNIENDLAIRAAAASIYSTCNLLSTES